MFEQVNASRSSAIATWSPPAAAIATAALAALLASHWQPHESDFLSSAILRAASAVLFVFICSAASAVVAFRFTPRPLAEKSLVVAASFAGLAVWLLPLLLTAWDGAIWAALIAGGFALSAAQQIRHYHQRIVLKPEPNAESETLTENRGLFVSLGARRRSPLVRSAVVCAASMQAGIIALTFGLPAVGALALAVSGILLEWIAGNDSEARYRSHFRLRNGMISVAAAIALMAAIGKFGQPPLYPGTHENGSAQGRQSQARANPDMHSSIILKSAKNVHTVIIAPRLRSRQLRDSRLPGKPMRIPFSGEYWFVPWPRNQPSANAMVQYGSPLGWVFTNEDRHPLKMVARQPLGSPVALSCCSFVQVALSALPSEAGSVGIGLFLVRSEEKRRSISQSLGLRELHEIATHGDSPDPERLRGTLRFAIPAQRRIEDFDEIHVLFDLRSPRISRSAKVEVEGFTLVP